LLLVIDVETSGLRPEEGHTVVELAAVALHPQTVFGDWAGGGPWLLGLDHFSTLVAPGRRLSPEAQAIHHLRDEELRCAPHLPQAINALLRHAGVRVGTLDGAPLDLTGGFPPNPLVFAAHNAQFDRAFIEPLLPPAKWLCTYRLSCHLYSNAPSHSNQTLRYYLGLDVEVRAALPSQTLQPHRALYDAISTAVLLKHMLATHTLDDLRVLQDQPVLQRTIRFGKYRNQLWSEVPRDYLQYVLRQNGPTGFDADVLHTANHYLNGGA
jgi:exodeoxyribonuclease X